MCRYNSVGKLILKKTFTRVGNKRWQTTEIYFYKTHTFDIMFYMILKFAKFKTLWQGLDRAAPPFYDDKNPIKTASIES